MNSAPSFLIIQTAFVGDVILATGLPCKLKKFFPKSTICFLVRKGNEQLVEGSAFVDEVWVWDKKGAKQQALWRLIRETRSRKFDMVINVQRHFSTGLLTALSGAKRRIGFMSNPMRPFFTESYVHDFPSTKGTHEIERNNLLIESITDAVPQKPTLQFTSEVQKSADNITRKRYVVMAPASVWATKELPSEKWLNLMDRINHSIQILLIGSPDDAQLCEQLHSQSTHPDIVVLAGKADLAVTAQLMEKAEAAFVNDSAPLHMASAFNTPTVAFFCSTEPRFGFFPLSEIRYSIEVNEQLACRPCGLHGKRQCPQVHYKCGHGIEINSVVERVSDRIPVFT